MGDFREMVHLGAELTAEIAKLKAALSRQTAENKKLKEENERFRKLLKQAGPYVVRMDDNPDLAKEVDSFLMVIKGGEYATNKQKKARCKIE